MKIPPAVRVWLFPLAIVSVAGASALNKSEWAAVATGARGDNVLRVASYAGTSATAAVGNLLVQFRSG